MMRVHGISRPTPPRPDPIGRINAATQATFKGATSPSSAQTVTSTAATPSCTVLMASTHFTHLSQVEKAERRLKGLYFSCPKKFSKEHLPHCTMKGIYLLELDEDTAREDNISMHAITALCPARQCI